MAVFKSKKALAAFTQEASEAFAYHDRDYDGKIATSSVSVLMNSMGHYPTAAECKQLLRSAGVTGSTFTLKDFLQMLQAHHAKSANFEKEILEALKSFDKTGSGMIDVSELRHALTVLGQKLSPQAAAAFVKAADRHGEGQINYRQFARLLTSEQSA